MRIRCLKYGLLLSAVLLLASCGAHKNTWASRNYHALVTRYNIYFNGNEAYKTGIKNMGENPKDDYSKLIPLYVVSVPGSAETAEGDMTTAIDKCRKAIKQHSIQKKPKPNPKKAHDAKWQEFLKKEEYNSQLKYAWLLQCKSEFHKGDFMGAVATAMYLQRHYATESEVVVECKLWQARAYAEMGWLYEAEDLLTKVNVNDLDYKLLPLYDGAFADLLMKEKRYDEAMPYLTDMLNREQNKRQKGRILYILAQLNEMQGNTDATIDYYQQVVKLYGIPYTMTFNAQLQYAQLAAGSDSKKVIKSLNKMTKDVRNKEYLDQIYYVEGNIYLQNGDENEAIVCYKKAIEGSTRNGIDKANVEVKLADLYYSRKDYVDAQPCYSAAKELLTTEHENYKRVELRAEVLEEFVKDYEIVTLQDSLQRLAQLSEEEQRKVVDKVIADLIAEEERQKEEAEEAEYAAQRAANNTSSITFANTSTDWYFYNPNLISKGKSEFQRKWGSRKLEDNWRRQNKVSSSSDDVDMYADTDESEEETSNEPVETDTHKPEYYLAMIPNTPGKIKQSNKLIATSLLNMGNVAFEKLEDFDLAAETYAEYQRRFADHEGIAESYFHCYQMAKQRGDEVEAKRCSDIIRSRFPNSDYAAMLSKADYLGSMNTMYAMQDSLYEATYGAYSSGEFATVKANYAFMYTNYKMSNLMPKFAFLNALSIGKTQPAEDFKVALDSLVVNYPQSDVTSMAKDILALIDQGYEAQQGSSHGTLLSRRDEQNKATADNENEGKEWEPSTQLPFMLVIEFKEDEQYVNQLLFDIAAFNFSKFMIKDFDLTIDKRDDDTYWLEISNLENLKEATWYYDILNAEATIHAAIAGRRYIFIAEDNFYNLGNPPFSWDDYVEFYNTTINKTK